MFDFHKDKDRYFYIQRTITSEEIIPFIEQHTGICEGRHILEIGCAEAGVLKAFLDGGNTGVGVELAESRFQLAESYLKEEISTGKASLVNKNIYLISDPSQEFGQLFDIIVLKDVIEHIPDQASFIPLLRNFLKPGGVIFFAYPPWWMPFGGHQQICNNKFLRVFPWFHLLPTKLYKFVLSSLNEKDATIKDLLEIKETGINIETIYKILLANNYNIIGETYWLTNPIYKFKFGIKKKKLFSVFTNIPYVRNFYTTAHYILFKSNT